MMHSPAHSDLPVPVPCKIDVLRKDIKLILIWPNEPLNTRTLWAYAANEVKKANFNALADFTVSYMNVNLSEGPLANTPIKSYFSASEEEKGNLDALIIEFKFAHQVLNDKKVIGAINIAAWRNMSEKSEELLISSYTGAPYIFEIADSEPYEIAIKEAASSFLIDWLNKPLIPEGCPLTEPGKNP